MNKKLLSFLLTAILLCTITTGLSIITTAHASSGGYLSLTFDDGIASQGTVVAPLLYQYNMVGTFYIPTGTGPLGSIAPDGLPYNKVNQIPISTLQTMQNVYNDEIGSHSVTHNDFTEMTDSQINYECSSSLATLQSWGLNIYDFAYPYGTGDLNYPNSIVSQYYQSARTAQWNAQIDEVALPTTEFSVMCYDAEYQVGNGAYSSLLPTTESYINSAISNNIWLVILVHNVVGTSMNTKLADETNCESNGGIAYADFVALLQYIQYQEQTNGLQVLTVHQAITYGCTSTPTPTPAPTTTPTPAPTTTPTPAPSPTPTPTPYIMTSQDWQNFWAWFQQQPQQHFASQTKQATYENKLLSQWKTQNGK